MIRALLLVALLTGCAAAIQGETWQTGVAFGEGRIGDCEREPIPSLIDPNAPVAVRESGSYCIQGSDAGEATGSFLGSILGFLIR